MADKIIAVDLMGTRFENVMLEWTSYQDGSPALILWGDMGQLAVATVRLHEQPAEGCVWIKDWSENSGIFSSLIAAGVIWPTGRTAEAGYAVAHEGRVL